jgi:hypothetical protein
MKRTSRTHSLRKGSNCPTCNAGKLIPIVYGLPDREVMEQSERGEIELDGSLVRRVRAPECGDESYKTAREAQAMDRLFYAQ